MRKKRCLELVDLIYEYAKRITGVKLSLPNIVDLRIIEGMSPHSFADRRANIQYIVLQVKHTERTYNDGFYISLTHELVSHYVLKDFQEYYITIFSNKKYEYEEGFAKLFAKKVYESILNSEIRYYPGYVRGVELSYYKIYEKNWHKLTNKNFAKWYLDCLKEIKETGSK
jgi:hypothetical protein